MEAIRAWLDGGKDYLTGAALYLEHGDDRDFIRLLTSERETPYKRKRLEASLRAIIGRKVKPAPTVEAVPIVKSWPADDATDDTLRNLRGAWLVKFKAMQDMHSRLMDIPTIDERGKVAFEILRLDDEISAIYAQRDHYLKTGELPQPPAKALITDPLKMAIRMENLRRYVRREESALAKEPGNTRIIARIDKFKKELNGYTERLGIADREA